MDMTYSINAIHSPCTSVHLIFDLSITRFTLPRLNERSHISSPLLEPDLYITGCSRQRGNGATFPAELLGIQGSIISGMGELS